MSEKTILILAGFGVLAVLVSRAQEPAPLPPKDLTFGLGTSSGTFYDIEGYLRDVVDGSPAENPVIY